MYHVRHRVYDPRRMIWLQRDPLSQLAGPDEYAYVFGEPRDYYDPMGLYSLSEWGEIGGAFLEGAHDGLIATTQGFGNAALEAAEAMSPETMAARAVEALEMVGVDTGEVGDAIKSQRDMQSKHREAFNRYMEEGLIDPDNPDLEISRDAGDIAFFAAEMAVGGGGSLARQGTKAASKAASKAAGAASRAGKGCASSGAQSAHVAMPAARSTAPIVRSNSKLVQDVATRAEAWGTRHGVPQTGSSTGTLKHGYADRLLTRYQRMFGNRGLSTEVRYINGQPWQPGMGLKGSVRLDVVEGSVASPTAVFDYKFGGAVLSPSRIHFIRSRAGLGSHVPVLEVKP